MQPIQQFARGSYNAFRKQGILGKSFMGGVSLFIFCCLCSVPLAILNPSAPADTTPIASNTKATAFMIPIAGAESTATSILPTSTLLPTSTSEPTPTLLPTAISSPLPPGASCIPSNAHQTGRVVDIVDGDTIKVLLDEDGKVYTIRYIGIDTPEATSQVEYFGVEATAQNSQLVFGKSVTLIKDVSEKDPYGRLLRYVLVDGIFVNYELVAQGYANTASFPPDVACIPVFQDAEQLALSTKLGLWNAPPTLVVLPTSPNMGSSGNAPCSCNGPDLDCTDDFSTHASAQACYNYCMAEGFGDIFDLDGNDKDGLACESLP